MSVVLFCQPYKLQDFKSKLDCRLKVKCASLHPLHFSFLKAWFLPEFIFLDENTKKQSKQANIFNFPTTPPVTKPYDST